MESKNTGQLQNHDSDTFDTTFPYGGGGRGGSVLMGDLKNGAAHAAADQFSGGTDVQSEFTPDAAADAQETASQIVSSSVVAPGPVAGRSAKRTASYAGMSHGRMGIADNANAAAGTASGGIDSRRNTAAVLPYGANMKQHGSLASMGPGRSETNDDGTTVGGAAASGMGLRSASQMSAHSGTQVPVDFDGGSSSNDDAMTQGTASPTRKSKKSK